MQSSLGRDAASRSLRARIARCVALTFLGFLLSASARAVVIRGRLTDALGNPVSRGMVRLVQGGKTVAFAYAETDGTFEIRSSDSGRFTLLGSAGGFLPAIGIDFYGGVTDVLQQDVILAANTVRQETTVSATGIPTPLPQLTSPVSVIPQEAMDLRTGIVDVMRLTPGAFMVQTGQLGSVTSLFMRGGNSTANLVTIDGVPADDIGGIFDFGTVSSTAVSKIDVVRGPDSAMYGTNAMASVVTIETPRGNTSVPQLNYEGSAGNLYTYQNRASIGGTWRRLDYFGAFSRIDSSNALPLDRYHLTTSAMNVGYAFNGNTQIRFTIRNADSVQGVPGAWDFQGVSQDNRQADQDLFSGGTLENWYKGKWHNLVRYGIARKREQEQQYAAGGTYLEDDPGAYGPGYVGNVVTIRGANGYSATGQVQLYTGNNYDQASNSDQLYYQSDYSLSPHFIGLFGFRYDNERGSYNDYYTDPFNPDYDFTEHLSTQRTNFEYNLQFQGEFWHRLFYSAGGAVEKNHLYGIAGTPRLGLSYVPVRPSRKAFHGTRFRANAATGVQEPSLAIEFQSLYTQLLEAGDTEDIEKYHITPQGAERSRTYDVGVDQNIFGEKLTLKLGYFHNMFNHQLEGVDAEALNQYFGLDLNPAVSLYEAYVNSLAYSAQGVEAELTWQPRPHFLFRGGYTYLNAKVLQSFASDAVAANEGEPTENPNLPGIPIGALGPLVGARPFRRAPNTGYFNAQYTRPRMTFSLTGAIASRSDDSTYLEHEDLYGGNTLLLPNRNLDFGYTKLDLGFTYALKHGFTYFAQLNNLMNNQHIGPIGYPGLPFTFQTGLRLQMGGR